MGKTLTAQEIKSVKGQGFLHNRGTSQFSGRVITKNGMLTSKQMVVLSEAAEKYGNGNITFTVRLTVEIPGIEFDNIEPFQKLIETAGMTTGGTGPKVRPIVACKGTTCIFGLCDTQGIAAEIHKYFYEGYRTVVLPHKFKIAIGGCPNNCAKPDLNDIGIVGQRVMQIDSSACRSCKKCGIVETCPMGAATLNDGKIQIDKTLCNNCGRCVGKCPFKLADTYEQYFKIYVGGRWGKSVRIGTALEKLYSKAELYDVIEKAILLFKSEGITGERFGQTCDRIGMEKVNEMLESQSLFERKRDILIK